MKIVFDSEEQKEGFIKRTCPYATLGIPKPANSCTGKECESCWGDIADMEVMKPVIFEIGKCYEHSSGTKMRIIGEVDTYFYGHCLMAETDNGEYKPVGNGEGHAIGWKECEDFAVKKGEKDDKN